MRSKRLSHGSERPARSARRNIEGQLVLCYHHEPPYVFTIQESLKSDRGDDRCPLCGQDDELAYELTDLQPEEYTKLYFGGGTGTDAISKR